MSLILISIAAAFCVMLASLVGIIFASKTLGLWMQGRLTYLATFSAGVLVVLAYQLIEEAFYTSEVALAAASVVVGVVILEIIHHMFTDTHHHHEVPADHMHTQIDGRRVLVSDAVHNVTDGFLIVPAFLIDWKVGLAATFGIFLHELVQEVSEFFILKEAGYSDRKALTLNFIASSTILLGITFALVLASFETLLALLAGFAAGGFISVVVRDLLPHAFASAKAHDKWLAHTVAAVIGILLMAGVVSLTPHEQEHADEQEYIGEEVSSTVISRV